MKHTITRYGHTWTIDANDEIMENVLAQGLPCEHHMLDWIEKNIPRGGVWIDAGANIGNHTIPFSFWADLVMAFEPMFQNTDRLRINVRQGRFQDTCSDEPHGFEAKVAIMECGLSDTRGELYPRRGGTGKDCQWILTPQPTEFPPVPVATLDSFATGAPVRLIKLDVEGMEDKVIIGGWETINRWKPELFIEIWEDDELDRIRAVLATIGYKLIERYGHAPTYHFSASGRYPVTYTKPQA